MKFMKKLLSIFLALTMLFSALPSMAEAVDITAFVTATCYHDFLQTKENAAAVSLPVLLTGEEAYTLDDVLDTFHQQYAPDGCDYACEESQWGLGLTKFWGDDSGNFGYYINHEMAMDLSNPVENGDLIDVFIYDYNHQSYAFFQPTEAELSIGESLSLTLSEAGYDAAWNPITFPCEGALLTVNGEVTDCVTDESGNAELTFDEPGTYLISATKETIVEDHLVPCLVPPHCVVTVTEPQYRSVMHKIAEKYSGEALLSDGNMIWFLCDLAMYNEVYPENAIALPESVEQACVDAIIDDAKDTTSASTMAKSILALRALGYDAKNLYDADGQQFDLVTRLTDLVDANDSAVTNIYTLPFVLLALSQGEQYATDTQINFLLNAAVSSKASWQNDDWGVDAMAFMLPALAPYCNDENADVAAAVLETIPLITGHQAETGAIGNAASTGLALAALSAVDTNVFNVVTNEQNIIDGLMTYLNESSDGFLPSTNSFSTEQGFRGLVAMELKKADSNRFVYDFSSYPMREAHATLAITPTATPTPTKEPQSSGGGGGGGYIPPKPTPTKEPAQGTSDVSKKLVLLQVTKRHPDIKIPKKSGEKTFSDITTHQYQSHIEALASRGVIQGKSSTLYAPADYLTRAEFSALITRCLGLSQKADSKFSDVRKADWFFDAVNTAYHYGIVKGVSDTNFSPDASLTRQEAVVMIHRAAALLGLTLNNSSDAKKLYEIYPDEASIADWAKDAVLFCRVAEILPKDATSLHPTQKIDRGETAMLLSHLLKQAESTKEVINDEK